MAWAAISSISRINIGTISGGDVMVTRGRMIDTGDIANFTNLTGDFYPIHIDQEFAKKEPARNAPGRPRGL
jgi:acyl dehydratase